MINEAVTTPYLFAALFIEANNHRVPTDASPGRRAAIEAISQREGFVEVHSFKKCNFSKASADFGWFVEDMAYRGQGQKVQKVMVQPIVSFLCKKQTNKRRSWITCYLAARLTDSRWLWIL